MKSQAELFAVADLHRSHERLDVRSRIGYRLFRSPSPSDSSNSSNSLFILKRDKIN